MSLDPQYRSHPRKTGVFHLFFLKIQFLFVITVWGPYSWIWLLKNRNYGLGKFQGVVWVPIGASIEKNRYQLRIFIFQTAIAP